MAEVTITPHSTAFTGDGIQLFRAMTLRTALRGCKIGLRPAHGTSGTKCLALVKEFTGKTYKRGAYDEAIADLTTWIAAAKASMPIEVKA